MQVVTPQITESLILEIVDETGADPRSVTKRLAGLRVRGAAGRSIDRALTERGIDVGSSIARRR